MKKYDIVLVSVMSPVLLGVYKSNKLLYFIVVDGKISDVLAFLFANFFLDSNNFIESKKINIINCGILANKDSKSSNIIESRFIESSTSKSIFIESNFKNLKDFKNFTDIYYARGVGSLSSIKLTHIFLHTLALSKNIKLHAINSFYFSDSGEIKAFGAMSFFLKDSKDFANIESNIYISKSININNTLKLPLTLQKEKFTESCTPLYITPPI